MMLENNCYNGYSCKPDVILPDVILPDVILHGCFAWPTLREYAFKLLTDNYISQQTLFNNQNM